MQLEARRTQLVESRDRIVGVKEAFSNIFVEQTISMGVLHLTKVQPCEDLSEEYSSNYVGFLQQDTNHVILMN